ncbi:MAG: hypothetical protein QF570_19195 [Myxococcota bacterium]|jgi:hypothetical protein|nr:hypothetical protein [Myxococcota bacterium]
MSKRTRWIVAAIPWLVIALATPATALDAKAGKKTKSTSDAAATAPATWYARTRIATKFGPVVNHYWSKGPWLRSETILAGHRVITIVNATHYYVCDLVMGEGTAIERSPKAIAQDKDRGRPFARELDDLIASGGEMIHEGVSESAGVPYRVYQLTNENGRRRVSVTDSDPPLPIRVETFVRSSGHNGLLEYAGWQRDLGIADSFFTAPDTIEWQRLSYDEYVTRAPRETIGPAPIYFRHLLHGE